MIHPSAIRIRLPRVTAAFAAVTLLIAVRPAMAESPMTTLEAGALLRALAEKAVEVLPASKQALLGKRDLSRSAQYKTEHPISVTFVACREGGACTRLVYLVTEERNVVTPQADFTWHQETLRPFVEEMRKTYVRLAAEATQLSDVSAALADGIRTWSAVPEGVETQGIFAQGSWIGACMMGLDEALERSDVVQARIWADETATATAALADLHRWADFLLADYLGMLDLQRRAGGAFETWDPAKFGRYDPSNVSQSLPAGRMHGVAFKNLTAVEVLAERLFALPRSYLRHSLAGDLVPVTGASDGPPSARWLAPDVRRAFARLRSILSPHNARLWDAAVCTPFERTYLENMLLRAVREDVVDHLATVLERYNRREPRGSLDRLMDVIFSRGGDASASSGPAERYDPRMLRAAADLTGNDDVEALERAANLTRRAFGGWENYRRMPSLKAALDHQKFDCVTATDLIGTLYRNAGHAGFYNVRWNAGRRGHSVGAVATDRPGRPKYWVIDGLDEPGVPAAPWPEVYVDRMPWPGRLAEDAPPVWTVEVFGRGLESYIWVEGYVVRGPEAGSLVQQAVPYLPAQARSGVARVRPGPAPATKALPPTPKKG